MTQRSNRIGFVGTRFCGTDGVSLEAQKWADVYRELGCEVFWYGGALDRDPEVSFLYEEAFFGSSENLSINERVFGAHCRDRDIGMEINAYSERLKNSLYSFVKRFDIDTLVVENALCIPMHIPLGMAITQFIAETAIPSIAHHHDFFWERDRFKRHAIGDYLSMAFPPMLPTLKHVTINTLAQGDLAGRRGMPSTVVPNVHDFHAEPPQEDGYLQDMRHELGFSKDDLIFLQPTRVIPRKGIEHALNLLCRLDDPRCKLVISHKTGDEGSEYANSLRNMAEHEGVQICFIDERIDEFRRTDDKGRKIYSLADAYHIADVVTYPSLYEGFGNAFLETMYFKKPIVVNRYTTFVEDIEPCGFDCITMDNFVNHQVIERVRRVINDSAYCEAMVEHNFEVAKQHFSYDQLRIKLGFLIDTLPRRDINQR